MAGDWTPAERKALEASDSYEEFVELCPTTTRSKDAWRFKRKRTEVNRMIGDEGWSEQKRAMMRELNVAHRRISKLQAYRDFMAESILAAAGMAQAVTIPPRVKGARRHREEVAVLEFSDVHMGALVEPEHTAHLGVYSADEFRRRLDVLTEAIAEIVDIQRKGGVKVDKLLINGLGDFVEGEAIFPGQGYRTDADLTQQVFVLGEEVVQRFFMPMCEVFPQVELFTVDGNHGRGSKFGSSTTSWDFVAAMWWHARMRGQANFNMHISTSRFLAYQQFQAVHLLSHGSEVKAYQRIPFYGLERAHGRYMALLGRFIDYLHVGHHHNLADVDLMFGKDIINGSFKGTTEYSVDKLQKGNQPKQLFFGLNEKHQTWKYDIVLADMPVPQPDERGILTPTWDLG
jgi:hypothetical protein